MFKQAVKTESKLRMAITGPSGSGKTYTALTLASALAGDGKVAVIDTEHASAAKYADLFGFDTAPADPPYHPDGLVRLINAAVAGGYAVLIVDSISHYWSGAGGVLDLKEDAERRMRNPNSYTAWKDVTPIHQRMVDALVRAPIHVIVTMRAKTDYILVDRNGKQTPQKVGMAPVQRDGFEYEFDVLMDMDIENVGRIQKTRCPALTGAAFVKPGAELAGTLAAWLTGADASQAPEPVAYVPGRSATAAEFARNAESLRSVEAIGFSNGRLTDWVNFVTDNRFDPEREDELLRALNVYCSTVADNGGKHTKAAAEAARASYRSMVAEGAAGQSEAVEVTGGNGKPRLTPVIGPDEIRPSDGKIADDMRTNAWHD